MRRSVGGFSEPEAVDLNAVVGAVLEDLELEIQQKGATVTVDLLPVINDQAQQLQQLFQNLFTNGLKYSLPKVPPRLHLTRREGYGHQRPEVVKEENYS